jgi:argonaute-like protein implicated in RNA metabolism and viral defense
VSAFFPAAFFVLTAVTVSAMPTLRRNLVTFFYVFTVIEETIYSLFENTQCSLYHSHLFPYSPLMLCEPDIICVKRLIGGLQQTLIVVLANFNG